MRTSTGKGYPVLPFAAIAVALVAIAVAASAQFSVAGQVTDLSGKVDALSKQLATQAGRTDEVLARVSPKTQRFSIIMGEGEIIQEAKEDKATGETKIVSEEMGGEEMLTGEFHRWEPGVLVVKKGDKVELTVQNPRSHAHSFVLPDFGVDTGRIPGRAEQPDAAKRTVAVTFTADKAGVFRFFCAVPFDHHAGNCDADHARMVGYLIVLEG